jgi:hypothetical protein
MNQSISSPKTFCVLPWLHRFTNIGGEIQVCCSSEEYDNHILSDSGHKLMAPSDEDDAMIMNTRFMKELRLQLLNGQWPQICTRCKITEDSGGISRRQNENYNFNDEISNLIENTLKDGTIPVNIRSRDMRLGNLCNLACRMCSPRSSSRWEREVKNKTYNPFEGINENSKKNEKWQVSKNIRHSFLEANTYLKLNARVDENKCSKLVHDTVNLNLEKTSPTKEGYLQAQHGIDETLKIVTNLVSFDQNRSSNLKWYQSDAVLTNFKGSLRNLKHLHFAGGEPLINPTMIKFLRSSIEDGSSQNITLTYNTNLTKIPRELKLLWPHFGGIKLFISIDGYGDLNDYIRHGSKWKLIEENLKDIESNHQRYGVIEAEVMCTTQAYNILMIDDLFRYLLKNYTFISQVPRLIDLHYPYYFRSQVLPAELKKIALKKFNDLVEEVSKLIDNQKISGRYYQHLDSIKACANFIQSEDYSHLYSKFITVTRTIDINRNQKIESVVPYFNF